MVESKTENPNQSENSIPTVLNQKINGISNQSYLEMNTPEKLEIEMESMGLRLENLKIRSFKLSKKL